MRLRYQVQVITFNRLDGYYPFSEVKRLHLKLFYGDEIKGLGICPISHVSDPINPCNLGGWICRNIGDGERYKQVIVNMALTALIDSYTNFIAIGSVLNPDENHLGRVALWQLWHCKESDYRLWIKQELIGKYPQLVHSVPSFDSFHSQQSVSFDSDPLLSMNIY